MKRLLALLLFSGLLLAMFGCDNSPMSTKPEQGGEEVLLTPRPQFVDERPLAEIQNYVMNQVLVTFDKKPPKPPNPSDTTDPNPNPPHKYAYVVGIADYEGVVNDLQFPDDDAMEMRSYLQGEGFSIRMDLNGNATADDITAGLQWLINQAAPGDEIVFYYSGHGAKAPGYGSSIISHDLYYVTHGYVMSYINSVDNSKKLVAMDACVLGDFHRDCVTGTVMATASNNSSSYDAPDLNNGAWTYFFLEGAENVGYIFAEDISSYAEAEMKAWAKPYHLRVSPKHTDKYSGMFDI